MNQDSIHGTVVVKRKTSEATIIEAALPPRTLVGSNMQDVGANRSPKQLSTARLVIILGGLWVSEISVVDPLCTQLKWRQVGVLLVALGNQFSSSVHSWQR